MAFSFPAANQSITKGADFYRVKARSIDQNSAGLETELGPGDLIPIDIGFSAIAVGPESDYDNYELVYFDPLGGVSVIPFSTSRPFVGRIPTNNAEEYTSSGGEKQQAFIRIADPSTMNGVLAPASGAGRIAVTFADIIVYTGVPPANLAAKRSPNRRSVNVSVLPFVELYYFIPGFGRKHLTVEASAMMIPDIDNSIEMAVHGLRMYQPFVSNPGDSITGPMVGKVLAQTTLTELQASTPLPNTTPVVTPLTQFFPALSFGYNAETSDKGYFDFYRVTLTSASTERPFDFYAGMGAHLNMEVRD